jgi:hypothetical protein
MVTSELIITLDKDKILPRSEPPDDFLKVNPGQRIVFGAGDFVDEKTVIVKTYPDGIASERLLGKNGILVAPRGRVEETVQPHDDEQTDYTIEIEEEGGPPNKPIHGYIKVVKKY